MRPERGPQSPIEPGHLAALSRSHSSASERRAFARRDAGPLDYSRLTLLDSLIQTKFTFEGLSRLLVTWSLQLLRAEECTLTIEPLADSVIRFDGGCRFGKVAVKKRPAGDETLENDFRIEVAEAGAGESEHTRGAASWLHASIGYEGRVFGTIDVFRRAHGTFGERDQLILDTLSRQFGFLLHHQSQMHRAQDMAVRDELTGLYNRRFLLQAMRKQIRRARNRRVPVSLLLLDIDHFKRFNDTWGHAVGDRVLTLVGNLMQSLFRSDDVVSRYGGEEFAILLCDHRPKSTFEHPRDIGFFAERLRSEAEKLQLKADDGQALTRITVSGGIATYPWDGPNAEELLRVADEALYRAKRAGRNRIYFADADAGSAG